MKVIEPSVHPVWCTPEPSKVIEYAGRTAYKSEGKIKEGSDKEFIQMLLSRGHESVLEHASACLRFICDRGVTHELVRHRLVSYTQESTRYCNYSGDQFGNEITVINPCFWTKDSIKYREWFEFCEGAEKTYLLLLELGAHPQEARAVLPNCLKVEIVVTANFREWRFILKLRTARTAHPQMRQVMKIAKQLLINYCPIVFEDDLKA